MAKKRREQVQQQNRKKRQQLYLLIGVGAAVLAMIIFGLYMLSKSAPLPEGVAEAYAGIEQGTTAEGYARLGSANAPIVVEEWASFGCPACKELHETQLPEIMDAVRAGYVQFIFKPITSIANNPNNDAGKAARAAVCAGQQSKFYEMHDIAFYWQGRYTVNGSRLDAAAQELDIDGGQLKDCYNSNTANAVIALSEREFRDRGFNSTPRVVVNGQEVNWGSMSSAVETQLEQLGLGG